MSGHTAEYATASRTHAREYTAQELREMQFYAFLIVVGLFCPILLVPYFLMLLLRAAWRICFSRPDVARANQPPSPPYTITATSPPGGDKLSWWWLVGFALLFVVGLYTFNVQPLLSVLYGSSMGSAAFFLIKSVEFLNDN